MAKFRPLRIGDETHAQRINPATEEIDGKIYVSQPGVVLGRVSSGDGPHEEILFDDLPGGPGGPGGASYTEVTYSEMQALIASNGLTPGGWYLITDANGTDLGFLTNAVTENTINVSGVGGYLNADFQAVGDYSGAPETFGTQLGIWRTSFEEVTIDYLNLTPDYVSYSTSSGLLDPAETFTTDLGTTGEVITDDGAGTVTVQNLSQALVAGEIITGDTSAESVTVDIYTNPAFAVGDTITGGTTGATAVIVTDDGASSMTAYMTSPGVSFDGSEILDNGNGVFANQDGAATSPTIVQGDVVIWNLLHWQLTDAALLNGTAPEGNVSSGNYIYYYDASGAFTVGETITGDDNGSTAVIVSDDQEGMLEVSDITGDWTTETTFVGDTSANTAVLDGYFPAVVGAYTLLDKATYMETYVEAWDVSEFDFPNNWIQRRADANVNDQSLPFSLESALIGNGAMVTSFFQWGRNSVIGNVSNGGEMNIKNVVGVFRYNTLLPGARIYDISAGESAIFEKNYLDAGATIYALSVGANTVFDLKENTLGLEARISDIIATGEEYEITGNNLFSYAYITSINGSSYTLNRNVIFSGGQISSLFLTDFSDCSNNVIENSGSITSIDTTSETLIRNNKIGSGATLGISLVISSGNIENNILENGASLNGINAGQNCSISGNKVEATGVLGGSMVLGDAAQVNNNTILLAIQVSNKTFAPGVLFNGNTIGVPMTETETITDNIEGKRSIPGFSDIPGTIDITGLNVLDCTAAWSQYRGIYNLTSSNATEAIDTIANPPTLFPLTIRPAAGVVLTITGTPYAGIAAGQIALKAASYTLYPGEYIVLDYDPATGCLIENRVVNGIL